MNYLKLKQKIYEAIERNPFDRSAYEEMFAVCREYEKIDFQTAHAWNGKKQYIQLASGISYKAPTGDIVNCEHDAIGNMAVAFVGTSGVQMGWLASQADMLADDWVFAE